MSKRPSREFTLSLCNRSGTPAAKCDCGLLWYGTGMCMDEGELERYEADPAAICTGDDTVSLVHFRGITWVDGCNCKIAAYLAGTESWLIESARYIGAFYTAHAGKEQARLDAICEAAGKIAGTT